MAIRILDNNTLLTACQRGMIKIWDLATLECKRSCETGMEMISVVFNPKNDCIWILEESGMLTMRSLDFEILKNIQTGLRGVEAMEVIPVQNLLVLTCPGNNDHFGPSCVQIRSGDSGECISEIPFPEGISHEETTNGHYYRITTMIRGVSCAEDGSKISLIGFSSMMNFGGQSDRFVVTLDFSKNFFADQ